jgi:hypothetical protein
MCVVETEGVVAPEDKCVVAVIHTVIRMPSRPLASLVVPPAADMLPVNSSAN